MSRSSADPTRRAPARSATPARSAASARNATPARSAAAALCAALLLIIPAAPGFAAEEPSGVAVFAARCAVCHGPEAAGIPGSFPSLHDQIVAFGKTPEGRDYLVMVVTTGLMGDLKLKGTAYRGVMPAQSGLTEAQVAAVLSYLAGDRGKAAGEPAITAADVTAARARHPEKSAQSTRALRPEYPDS